VNLKTIEAIVSSQFVWAILCIIGIIFAYRVVKKYIEDLKTENQKREEKVLEIYETQKSESKEREERLMCHVEKTTETLNGINKTLETIQGDVRHVNGRVDDVWQHVSTIRKEK
jgi:uncharacterized protein YoxC